MMQFWMKFWMNCSWLERNYFLQMVLADQFCFQEMNYVVVQPLLASLASMLVAGMIHRNQLQQEGPSEKIRDTISKSTTYCTVEGRQKGWLDGDHTLDGLCFGTK